ncbi:MAG: lipoate--protein ligase [Bacteroidales bacterium]|jgi:lipoate-protein ligase A|nr:lipoate--protein ligase [Bacteroidales bacterium]
MICIRRTETDPYFNIAAEEYVLHEFTDDCFMLWRNEPSVIVGKHQNTLAEINYDFVAQNKIKVVRRISGGGAVFHDLGNINFTFIMNGQPGQLVDFRKFTQPIIDVLATLDIEAKFEGRNDLTIDGKKFSGNAEHVFKNRVLHHGTLLYRSTINNLAGALNVDPDKFRDKAIKSVRSRVTNISEHLKEELEIEDFISLVMNHILEMYPNAELYQFSDQDRKIIQELVQTKYGTWDWNYGYSPKYNFKKSIRTNGGKVEFNFDVKDGIIEKANIYGDFFSRANIHDLEQALIGIPHREKEVLKVLGSFEIGTYFKNITLEELIPALF